MRTVSSERNFFFAQFWIWITFWLAVFVEVHFKLQLTQVVRDASCTSEKSLEKRWILGRFSLAFGAEVDSGSLSATTVLPQHDKPPRSVILGLDRGARKAKRDSVRRESPSESLDSGTSRVAIGGGVGYVEVRFIPDIFWAL